jgi:hypothetical protein
MIGRVNRNSFSIGIAQTQRLVRLEASCNDGLKDLLSFQSGPSTLVVKIDADTVAGDAAERIAGGVIGVNSDATSHRSQRGDSILYGKQRWTRFALIAGFLALLVSVSAVAAQEPNRRITDTTGSMGGTANVVPIQTSYTATDDLWVWRSNKNRTSFESGDISAALTFLEAPESGPFWRAGEEASLTFQTKIDLRWYVPDMDSDSSAMLTASGRASGDLNWFIPDIDDEVIVGGLQWDARVAGAGFCKGDDCTVIFEMSGPLSGAKGQNKCGQLSVAAVSSVSPSEREVQFKSRSGMGSDPEIVEYWSANVSLDVARDGSTCFIGETEKNVNSSRVTFYYGEESGDPAPHTLGEPDALRVMPGDNVKIIAYRDIPVRISEVVPDGLWDSAGGPLVMMQDMRVELRYDPRTSTVQLGGDVRGVFPKEWTLPHGLIAEGTISGRGLCEGENCTIQMIRNFEILQARSGSVCGSMTLGVTVDYVHGQIPQWTFRTDGRGSITLRDHQQCVLISFEDVDDI